MSKTPPSPAYFIHRSLMVLPLLFAATFACKPRGYKSIPGCTGGWLIDPKGGHFYERPDRASKKVKSSPYGASLTICGFIGADIKQARWYYASWPGTLQRAWLFSDRITQKRAHIKTRGLGMRDLLKLYWQADGGLVVLVGLNEPNSSTHSGNGFTVREDGRLEFYVSGAAAKLKRIHYGRESAAARLEVWKETEEGGVYEVQRQQCQLPRRTLTRAIRGLTKYSSADMSCRIISRHRTTSEPPEDF